MHSFIYDLHFMNRSHIFSGSILLH